MRTTCALVFACAAAGCARVGWDSPRGLPGTSRASFWPAHVPALAAAGEDAAHQDIDTEPAPPPDKPAAPVAPRPARPERRESDRKHHVGVLLGVQTFVEFSALDAGSAAPDALVGLSYRFTPLRGKLAYEAAYQFATTELAGYSTDVAADSTVGMWKGTALWRVAQGRRGLATYVSGGLAIVDEEVSYRNRGDGFDLLDFRNTYGALSLGVGQEFLDGAIDLRYDMTLPLGSASDSSYHYLTVGYTF